LFNRTYHQNIAEILGALDTAVLESASCFLGGGTAIALMRGEYRQSDDIDFVVSDISGYRELRSLLAGGTDLGPIARSPIALERDVRGDRYGIRTVVVAAAGARIKFEIVHEGRIDFDSVSRGQRVCGVVALSTADMAASKLLANDDRWADRGYHSRDLIDLAMLDASSGELAAALEKVKKPYPSAIRSLNHAIDHVFADSNALPRYMRALQMDSHLLDQLASRIEALRGLDWPAA
jgi:hypothetical protein